MIMSTKDKRPTPNRDAASTPGKGTVARPDGTAVPIQPHKTAGDVQDFIAKMKTMAPAVTGQRGRLVFAMDATMSRQPTWDMALSLQSEMFAVVKDIGGLDVQLVFFRGTAECRASRWVSDPGELQRLMTTVSCRGGLTQLARVLTHAAEETGKRRVNAVVFVFQLACPGENRFIGKHDRPRCHGSGRPERFHQIYVGSFKIIGIISAA